jgi:hypothetical protein
MDEQCFGIAGFDNANPASRSFGGKSSSVKKKTPNQVCVRASQRNVKLTVKQLPEDKSYVLIEGDKAAFQFLSNLFAAHAEDEDCGFQIAPNGPGNAFFKKGSKLGLYLHRLPCLEKNISSAAHY